MKWRDRLGPKQLVTLCVLASLLYFSHAFVFFMAAFFIGVVSLCFGLEESHLLAEKGGTRPDHTICKLLKRVLVPQLAFLPCLAIFFVSSTGSQPGTNPEIPNFLRRLLVFHELYVLVDSKGVLGILRVCLMGIFLLWGSCRVIANVVKQRKLVASDGLGILAAACLSLYVVLPGSLSGGGMIPERLAWFSLCGALLWFSSKEWTIKARQAGMAVSTLVVVLGLIGQTGWRYQMSQVLNAYDSVGRLLEPQKTILSLCYCNQESNPKPVPANLRFRPLEHAGDIVALEGRALSIYNYEAILSTFPVEYNPRVNAKTFFSSIARKPQKTDIADYEVQTGETIDYVLIWGVGLGDSRESGSILDQQLRSNYEEIYTSSSPALLRLFKRR